MTSQNVGVFAYLFTGHSGSGASIGSGSAAERSADRVESSGLAEQGAHQIRRCIVSPDRKARGEKNTKRFRPRFI